VLGEHEKQQIKCVKPSMKKNGEKELSVRKTYFDKMK
jgi:hypothetical protein